MVEEAFERGWGARGGDGYDSLMIAGVGEAVELTAVLEADGDILGTGELDDFFDAGVLAALGD